MKSENNEYKYDNYDWLQNASASPMTSAGHPMASTPGAGEPMMMGGAGPGGMPPGFGRQASRGSPGMPGQQQRYNGPPRPMPPNTRPDQMFQPGPGGMPPGMFDPMRAGPMGGPRGPGMPPGPPRGMAPNGGGPPPNVNSYAMRPGAPGPPGMMQGYRYGPPQMVNGPGTPIMPSPHDEQRTFMMAAGPGPSAGPQPNQLPPNSAVSPHTHTYSFIHACSTAHPTWLCLQRRQCTAN
jgi:hypothetical protein